MIAGVQVSSFKPMLTTVEEVFTAFGKIKNMGCEAVQVQWIDPSVPDEAVKEALSEYKLDCVSTQDRIDLITGNLERFLLQNRLWGSKDICASGVPDDMRSYEGVTALIKQIKELRKMAMDNGQTLSYHARKIDYDIFGGVSAYIRVLDEISDLRVCLDVYHARRAGYDPIELIKKYAGRIDIIHYKEEDASGKLVPVGMGMHQWDGVTKAAKENGVKYALVEQEKWEEDPFELLGASFKETQRLISL